MISSMTGYALASRDIGRAVMQIELRSINSRYLDLAFRINEELRFAEPLLREQIQGHITRGKLECRLSLQAASSAPAEMRINEDALGQLAIAQARVQAHFHDAKPMSVGEILRWPGVLSEDETSTEALSAELQTLAREAIADLIASRQREGAKLATMLKERVITMRALVERATPLVPASVAEYRERLTLRLREAVATLDEDRVRQEVTLFAQRVDVAEELSRLIAHLDEVARVLDGKGATGKRLDFLMQELNREANTLASKSTSTELTAISVDMKVMIEQMREQVQNLE